MLILVVVYLVRYYYCINEKDENTLEHQCADCPGPVATLEIIIATYPCKLTRCTNVSYYDPFRLFPFSTTLLLLL